MTDRSPTVALIHATPASMAPAHGAFADRFPQARLWNILDDRLITEAEAAGGLTPPLRNRMRSLIRYAADGGADAVMLTCSLYGPVAIEEAATSPRPVLASDQALFDAVRTAATAGAPGAGGNPAEEPQHGGDTATTPQEGHQAVVRPRARRITVLGPIRAGVDDTVARLGDWLGAGKHQISGVVVDGVHEAALAGDEARLAQLVVDAARRVTTDSDIIVLGQFSLSPARPAVAAAVSVPVLSPPHLAADVLRARLTAGALT
jgi:hypothetical protein